MTNIRKKERKGGPIAFIRTFWRQVIRYTITGMLAWMPLIVTIWAARLLINNPVLGLENLLKGVVNQLHIVGEKFGWLSFLRALEYRFGYGLLIAILVFLSTGLLTNYLVGRRLIGAGERIIQRIPLISRIYRAIQQIRDVFLGRGGAIFQKVCLIEYPRAGMIAVAFVTSVEQGLVQHAVGKELIAVFVPTTPNPTSGYLVYLPRSDVKILDISVEEAMKLVVSAGAYIPGKLDEAGNAALPDAGPREVDPS